MRLVTFEVSQGVDPRGALATAPVGFEPPSLERPGARRLGALLTEGPGAPGALDLNRAFAMKLAMEDVGAPEAEADSLLPSDLRAFLAAGAPARDAARVALAFARDAVLRYDAPDLERAGVLRPLRSVRLCAPLPRPGKIVGVARNYPAHAAECGEARPPEEPVLFLKAPSSVIGPEDDVVIPAASSCVDYEGELAAVIGRRARNVAAARALEHVAGWTAANDVTARDFQDTRGQRFIGKSCDTFAPLGPALVTRDEVPDPQDLGVTTRVSGETRQTARTKEMIFPVAEIVAFVSKLMTLEPGDVILTGTPAGVGAANSPPRWLRDGDVVEVEIERVGMLRNHVRAARRE